MKIFKDAFQVYWHNRHIAPRKALFCSTENCPYFSWKCRLWVLIRSAFQPLYSYLDIGEVIMRYTWIAVYLWEEFCLQQDLNPEAYSKQSETFTTWPSITTCFSLLIYWYLNFSRHTAFSLIYTFSNLWANSADIFLIFVSPEIRIWHFMQTVSIGKSLKPIFWKRNKQTTNYRSILQYVCWKFYPECFVLISYFKRR